MIYGGLQAFRGKHVLLLQGPLGPFFRRLADDLRAAGATVHKVNFNGGDWLFFAGAGTINFRERPEEWPAFFEALLDRLGIDVVLLFGDCRLYHRKAHVIASKRGLGIGVFEEGYLRPDWITLERFGVNGHSQIPREPDFYRGLPPPPAREPEHRVKHAFRMTVLWAMLYYFVGSLLKPLFPHYRHHRPFHPLEALPWIRALWRKIVFAVRERGMQPRLAGDLSKRYFLVPLQVHNDAQVCVHSPYADVSEFIEEVVESFASHAPVMTNLVIKHHPRDRGYHDYSVLIRELRKRYGLGGRLVYVHDLHLPTLLDHALGVVVINSTVGLSALQRGVPTKTTGNAFYDMDGLTFQGGLEEFWGKAWSASPNRELFRQFKFFLQSQMLINGSFYARLAESRLKSGICWTGDAAWLPFEPPMPEEYASVAGMNAIRRNPSVGKANGGHRSEPAHTV